MNTLQEKQYIYDMLRDITKERRKLVDMYFDLKQRLDFLNSMEERGIEDLSITGYVDLYNKNQKEALINNIKRETEYQIEKIENHHIIEESEKSIIPKEEVQRAIENERLKKRSGRVNRERIEGAVVTVLKDAGVPLKLNELLNRVNTIVEDNISKGNFQTNILPDLLNKNSKIERPMKGFYQYR